MNPLPIQNPVEDIVTRLRSLKMPGMADALDSMDHHPNEFSDWSWTDRLAWLVQAQEERRFNNKVDSCLRNARLRYPMAGIADILVPEERGLEMDYFGFLSQETWLKRHDNVILLGASGSGKTYLACAVGAAVCRLGIAVRYVRTDDLLRDLAEAKMVGTYDQVLQRYVKPKLLILDEFLLTPLVAPQPTDLLNVIERRYLDNSLIICTQFPIEAWLERLSLSENEAPLCEAILDRIVHAARVVPIGGEISMRERLRNSEVLHNNDSNE